MKENINYTIGILCAIGCEIIYGMSFIFTKQATDVASPYMLLGWRFALAFIAMSLLVFLGIIKVNIKGKNKKSLGVIAIFFPVIYFIGETFGISKTTAAESGVALASIPVAAMIASTVILKKKPTKAQIIGIGVTALGVIITVLAVGGSSSFSLEGYSFLLLAVFAYSIYCVYVERAVEYTGTEITYAMLLMGALAFLLLAVVESAYKGNLDKMLSLPLTNINFLIAVLYQGIGCSIIAFLFSNIAIARVGVNKMASFIGIATIVSILSAAIILKESFGLLQGIGAVVILAGVYIANYQGKS